MTKIIIVLLFLIVKFSHKCYSNGHIIKFLLTKHYSSVYIFKEKLLNIFTITYTLLFCLFL